MINVNKLLSFTNSLGINIHLGPEPEFVIERFGKRLVPIIVLDLTAKEALCNPLKVSNRLVRTLIHELGHYLIAPLGRRHRKDFGIPPEGNRSISSQRKWDLDEAKATVVQNYLNYKFGGKYLIHPLRSRQFKYLCKKIRTQTNKWWLAEGKAIIDNKLFLFNKHKGLFK